MRADWRALRSVRAGGIVQLLTRQSNARGCYPGLLCTHTPARRFCDRSAAGDGDERTGAPTGRGPVRLVRLLALRLILPARGLLARSGVLVAAFTVLLALLGVLVAAFTGLLALRGVLISTATKLPGQVLRINPKLGQ